MVRIYCKIQSEAQGAQDKSKKIKQNIKINRPKPT